MVLVNWPRRCAPTPTTALHFPPTMPFFPFGYLKGVPGAVTGLAG